MDNRFRILFLTQLPPPVHGSAVISKTIAESKVINKAFNINLIPLHFAKSMRDLGTLTPRKVIKMLSLGLQIISVIRHFQPHLVYFTISPKGFSFYRDVLYVAILKLYGLKIVYHLHVKGLKEESEKSFIKLRLYKFVFRHTNIITLSTYLVDDLTSFYQGHPFIVNNGVDAVTGLNPTIKQNNNSKNLELLYLSNLMHAKGIYVFLEAVLLLSKTQKHFSARIIGNAADVTAQELHEYIRKNNLTDIVVLDKARYGEEKYKALIAADIFIHPTLNDAFPLVILEAMQFQLPVISTYEGAIPEIVADGISGYIVPKNDAAALAEKTLHLMLNAHERLKMGVAGRRRYLTQYTTEQMETNVKEVLLQITSSNSSDGVR